MTVKGPIPGKELGITLPHEHLLLDMSCYYLRFARLPVNATKKALGDAPVTMDILGEIRRDWSISRNNMKLNEVDLAIEELMYYKKAGGKSLVELTLPEIGRNVLGLLKISETTGINIVCGTGAYLSTTKSAQVKKMRIDELRDLMIHELTEGIDNTDIKAGIIGELGCSELLAKDEKKTLQAGGKVQAITGAPLTIHPAFSFLKKNSTVNDYLDLIEKEGADLSKVYVSHMDLSLGYSNLDYHKHIMDNYEVTLSYDTMGSEYYLDSLKPGVGNPTDKERVSALLELLKSGYEKQMVMSHDVCLKTFLRKYGGYGYAHILNHIIPTLRANGVSSKQIRTMITENPKRILSYI